MKLPTTGEIYQHYGNRKLYKIIGIALHTEEQRPMVVYQGQYDDEELGFEPLFVRPLDLFQGKVQHNGETVRRFEKQ